MQWWGAVSQQFQSIAAKTMQDMQQHAAATASAKPASAKSATVKPSAAKPRAAVKTGATAKARKTTRRV
jgi:hypothetical protein